MFEFVYVIPGCDLDKLHAILSDEYGIGRIPYFEVEPVTSVTTDINGRYLKESNVRITIPEGGDKNRFFRISRLFEARGLMVLSHRFKPSSDGGVYLADERIQREMGRW